jgi:adenylate cyclase
LLCAHLERQGHQVAAAPEGLAGWELVRSEPFDAVLLDVLIPELDGYRRA